jgi:hypothetical protein
MLDVIVELESQSGQTSIFKVFEVVREKAKETQKVVKTGYSSYSFSDLFNQRSSSEVIVISVTKKYVNKLNYYLVNVNDISDYQTAGLMKIQHFFQTTLTNGLSHERLTPLNGIILNTELVLSRFEKENT